MVQHVLPGKLLPEALQVFRAVRGKGLARVDFFLEEKSGRVIFSEINTMPGFTSISMWPMLWEAAGVPISRQVDLLAQCALGWETQNK